MKKNRTSKQCFRVLMIIAIIIMCLGMLNTSFASDTDIASETIGDETDSAAIEESIETPLMLKEKSQNKEYDYRDSAGLSRGNEIFHFREGSNRAYGYNETYAQMGGLIETANSYMFCAASERTLSLDVANVNKEYCGHSEARDLFVQILKKDFYETTGEAMFRVSGKTRVPTGKKPENAETKLYLNENVRDYGVIWLTELDDSHFVANPKIVNIGDGKAAILWEEREYDNPSTGVSYYLTINDSGKIIQSKKRMDNVLMIADTELAYKSGVITWATNDANGKSINCLNVENNSFAKKAINESIQKTSINPAASFHAYTPDVVNFWDDKGRFNIASYSDNVLTIYRYDGNYNYLNKISLNATYPLFGSIISVSGNYYVLWGTSESGNKLCMNKYSYDGTLVDNNYVKGGDCNPYIEFNNQTAWGTDIPFDAGNCSLAYNNGTICCNYARQMYNGHQSNHVLYFDADTLERLNGDYNTPYSSHSFDQRVIATSDGNFLFASHGDAFPRAFVLEKTLALDVNFKFDDWEHGCRTLQARYSDQYFESPSEEYNHSLAYLTLCMELSSWTADSSSWGESGSDTSELAKTRYTYIEDAYKKMGFENAKYYNYGKSLNDGSDKVAFSIAKNARTDVIAIVIRGGNYGCEWKSNFNVGDGTTDHVGWNSAADEVFTKAKSYIEKQDGKVKVWITGYSRGAAVANLVAKKMNSYAGSSSYVDANSIFAYTFATPQGALNGGKDKNIFNIVNPGDPVPSVAPASWGYKRNGQTKYFTTLPSINTVSVVEKRYKQLNGTDISIMGNLKQKDAIVALMKVVKDVFPTAKKSKAIQEIGQDLMEWSKTRVYVEGKWVACSMSDYYEILIDRYGNKYFESYQFATTHLYETTNGKFILGIAKKNCPEGTEELLKLIYTLAEIHGLGGDDLDELLSKVLDTKSLANLFLGIIKVDETLVLGHTPDVYLSWMETDEYRTFNRSWTKLFLIMCPVDINVYDAEGIKVAEVKNHEIIDASIPVVVGQEKTEVFLSADTADKYRIEIIPTDDGEMNFVASELDVDGNVNNMSVFPHLPIEKDKAIWTDVEDSDDVDDNQTVLYDGETEYITNLTYNEEVELNFDELEPIYTLVKSLDQFTSGSKNYENNSTRQWLYRGENPDAVYTAITFSEDTYTEPNYDFITLYNKNNKKIASFSGKELAGKTVAVPGGVVRLVLTTDSSNTERGFKVVKTKQYESINKDLIKLNKSKASVEFNDCNLRLYAYYPDDENVILPAEWSSSSDTIAEVQDGLIMPRQLGNVDITANVEGIDLVCNVDVLCDIVYCDINYVREYNYTGKVITPKVNVKFNGKNLAQNEDYKLSYSGGRKNVGYYSMTITAMGQYTGKVTYRFSIIPKGTAITKLTKGKKSFSVKWKKQSAKMSTSTITGYQIRYSTSSKMTSAKTKTVKGYKSTSKKITKLSTKKKYYVQVRTYKTVSGKTYYSSWSKVKSVKTK